MTPRVYTTVLICKRRVQGSEWHRMKLLDQLVQDGDRLFRWRSYCPLVLIPVVIAGVITTAPPFSARVAERLWECASVAVALAGLALRVWAVGSAPSGTSERSTVDPRASQLRTTGPYSVVRHPLYVANGLMALGLSLFPGIWYLPVILALAAWLYYERIAIREEAFLAEFLSEVHEASAAPRAVSCACEFHKSWRGQVAGRRCAGAIKRRSPATAIANARQWELTTLGRAPTVGALG